MCPGNHWQILTDLFIDIISSLVSIAYLTRAYRLLVVHEHQLFRDCYTSSPSAVLQCLDPIVTLGPFVNRYNGTRSCKAVFFPTSVLPLNFVFQSQHVYNVNIFDKSELLFIQNVLCYKNIWVIPWHNCWGYICDCSCHSSLRCLWSTTGKL